MFFIALFVYPGIVYSLVRVPLQESRFFRVSRVFANKQIEGFLGWFSDSLEERDNVDLKVEGILPSWVSGQLIRNGPALFGTLRGERRYDHIFDGLAKLSSYHINNGKVKFSTKFLRSKWYKEIVEKSGDIPPSVTTGPVYPKFNFLQKVQAALTSSVLFDNVPVNVHHLAGKAFVAVTDAPVQLEFNPVTLETIGRKNYANSIVSTGGIELFSTAHPHLCKERVSSGKYCAGNEQSSFKEEYFSYNYFLEMRPLSLPGLPDSNIAHIARIDAEGKR